MWVGNAAIATGALSYLTPILPWGAVPLLLDVPLYFMVRSKP
jgi:hypothetical protein